MSDLIDNELIKTWFITGASSGIGHELALQLLGGGFNVVAVARRIPKIDHENVLCLSADVTNHEAVTNALNLAIERFGRIDVVVNNAGFTSHATCEEENLEHLKDLMEVNYFGAFNVINAILPHFRAQGHGTIVNNTSMHGLSYRPYGMAYCSSKHALEGLTSVLRLETKAFCRVMAFELGWFPGTELVQNSKSIQTAIPEYRNIVYDGKQPSYIENDLKTALSCLIEQIKEADLPRHLMLGQDCLDKVSHQIEILKACQERSYRFLERYTIRHPVPQPHKDSLIEFFLSLKNEYKDGVKYKVFRLLGIKFKFPIRHTK